MPRQSEQEEHVRQRWTGTDHLPSAVDSSFGAFHLRYNRLFDQHPFPLTGVTPGGNDGSVREGDDVLLEQFINSTDASSCYPLNIKCQQTAALAL